MLCDIKIETKLCKGCNEVKAIDNFTLHKGSKDGYRYKCKLCIAIESKEYRLKNKEVIKEKSRLYWKSNKDKLIAYNVDYVKNNKERRKIYIKQYQSRHRESLNKYIREWRKDNKNYKIYNLDYNRMYYEKNKIRLNQYRNKFRNNNLNIKLSNYISTKIRMTLQKNKYNKSWVGLLGYNIENLIQHLEKQFKENMSWNNYGRHGWHIDHIIPISWWKFESYEDREFKQCWALCNLQPLWAIDNLRKGNRRI
jgi:hypothetical protein